MGKNIVEFCYGGVFANCPFVLSLIYLIVGGYKKLSRRVNVSALILMVTSFIIGAFDVNGAGIIQRYMSDMVFGVLFAATLVWISLLSLNDFTGEKDITRISMAYKLLFLACVAGIAFGFLTVIASGDSVNIHNYNPVLYYKIASYFKF